MTVGFEDLSEIKSDPDAAAPVSTADYWAHALEERTRAELFTWLGCGGSGGRWGEGSGVRSKKGIQTLKGPFTVLSMLDF